MNNQMVYWYKNIHQDLYKNFLKKLSQKKFLTGSWIEFQKKHRFFWAW